VHEEEEITQTEPGPDDAGRVTLGQEREGALEPSEDSPVRPDEGEGGAPAH
jgi:hypothetical protein